MPWSDQWVFLSCQPLHLDSRLQCCAHHLLWVPGKATNLELPFPPHSHLGWGLVWSGDAPLGVQPKLSFICSPHGTASGLKPV